MYHRNTHHLRTGGKSIVFCCGYNSSSLLGVTKSDVEAYPTDNLEPYTSDVKTFVFMRSLQERLNQECPGQHVCQIVLQFSKAYFLTSLGHVYSSSSTREVAFDSILPDRVVEMRSGQNRTLFRTEFGQIYVKSDGPTLTKVTGGDKVNNVKLFGVGGLHYWLLDDETNRLYGEGELNGVTVEKAIELNSYFEIDEKVREIVTGGNSFVLITNKNNIYVYGEKEAFGSVDDSNYIKPTRLRKFDGIVKSVVCGWYFTVILTIQGQLWMAGRNTYQQLSSKRANQQDNLTAWFLDNSLPLEPNEEIDQIGSGSDHILISTTFGKIYTRGMNTYGQLGIQSDQSTGEFNEPHFKQPNYKELILQNIGPKYSISFADNNFNTLSSFLIIHSIRESKEISVMRCKLVNCSNQSLLSDVLFTFN